MSLWCWGWREDILGSYKEDEIKRQGKFMVKGVMQVGKFVANNRKEIN